MMTLTKLLLILAWLTPVALPAQQAKVTEIMSKFSLRVFAAKWASLPD